MHVIAGCDWPGETGCFANKPSSHTPANLCTTECEATTAFDESQKIDIRRVKTLYVLHICSCSKIHDSDQTGGIKCIQPLTGRKKGAAAIGHMSEKQCIHIQFIHYIGHDVPLQPTILRRKQTLNLHNLIFIDLFQLNL